MTAQLLGATPMILGAVLFLVVVRMLGGGATRTQGDEPDGMLQWLSSWSLSRIATYPATLAALIMILSPLIVQAGSFEVAMTAALEGPEKKKIKIFDHHFNVKPVEIKREGGKITVIGHISHHLSGRSDDQIYYRIVKQGNTVLEIKRDINRGGYAGLVAPIVAAAGSYLTGVPIPPDKVEGVGRAIGKAVDGSWESACDFLISNIALRVK